MWRKSLSGLVTLDIEDRLDLQSATRRSVTDEVNDRLVADQGPPPPVHADE